MAGIYIWYHNQLDNIRNAQFIVVSKQDMRLRVFDYAGEKKAEYGIACGKNYGQKEKVGDMKTPEGIFHVVDVEDASNRTHDFGDGKGPIEGAYGPYFIRLATPGSKGIGIHGTHDPNSIGTRATEGCIRLKNEDVSNLAEHVFPGEVVMPGFLLLRFDFGAFNWARIKLVPVDGEKGKKRYDVILALDTRTGEGNDPLQEAFPSLSGQFPNELHFEICPRAVIDGL